MSTTPAPTDLDTPPLDAGYDVLDALVQSATPGPWDDEYSETHEVWIVYDADQEKVAECFDSATAALIAAARNALPALLDELAKTRREAEMDRAYGHEMAGKVTDLCRDMGVVQAERDAAREELAKVRAELDEARQAVLELGDEIIRANGWEPQNGVTVELSSALGRLIRERDSLARKSDLYFNLTQHHGSEVENLRAQISRASAFCQGVLSEAIAPTEYQAVMAQEVLSRLANPATTAEPAAPKATCGHAYIGNEGEFTCDLYAPHNGKQHWASLAEFAWTDERAA